MNDPIQLPDFLTGGSSQTSAPSAPELPSFLTGGGNGASVDQMQSFFNDETVSIGNSLGSGEAGIAPGFDNTTAQLLGLTPREKKTEESMLANLPFVKQAKESFDRRGQKLSDNVDRMEEEALEDGEVTLGEGAAAAAKSVVPVLGAAAGVVTDTVVGGVLDVADKVTFGFGKKALGAAGSKALEGIQSTELGREGLQKLSEGFESYQAWAEENPDTAANIGGVVNLAEIFPAAAVAKLAKKGTTKVASKVNPFDKAARLTKEKQNLESLLRRTTGSKQKDLGAAREAIRSVDIEDVSTIKNLDEAFDAKLGALKNSVDEAFEADTSLFKTDDLITTTKVGDEVVEQNFATKAFDQLEELFTQTEDATELAKLNGMKKKLDAGQFSAKDVNDLARLHGKFKSGFSDATGKPLTGVNPQAYENVRKGLKDQARSKIKDKNAKIFDEEMSAILKTQKTVKKSVDRVEDLKAKLDRRGFFEKTGAGVAKTADALSFNFFRGVASGLTPSNVGMKTMNSLDIEKQLGKNLKKIKKLDTLVSKLDEAVGEAAKKKAAKEISKEAGVKLSDAALSAIAVGGQLNQEENE